MSIFQRAKEATEKVAGVTKRGAMRGKLELEIKRLEGKINGEKEKIGLAVYPLIADGRLSVDLPEVSEAVATIRATETELAAKRTEIEALGRDDEEEPAAEAASA